MPLSAPVSCRLYASPPPPFSYHAPCCSSFLMRLMLHPVEVWVTQDGFLHISCPRSQSLKPVQQWVSGKGSLVDE